MILPPRNWQHAAVDEVSRRRAIGSVASNKGRFNGGRGIEGIGVPPHELTPYDPADLAHGIDTQIKRAEELLTKGLPKNKVPWEI